MVPAEPALDGDNNVIEFRPNKNNSASFKLKQQIKKKTNRKRWHKRC